MYYVYLLRSLKYRRKLYIGFTSRPIERRLQDHNYQKVDATRASVPWELLYYEMYQSEADARARELKLKQYGSALGHLKKRLRNALGS